MPQFESLMAEKERFAGRASALEIDLKDARSQQQQLQASLRRAQEVLCFLTTSTACPAWHVAGS